jgi:hypothetical protein
MVNHKKILKIIKIPLFLIILFFLCISSLPIISTQFSFNNTCAAKNDETFIVNYQNLSG